MFAVALTDEVCGEISAEWEKNMQAGCVPVKCGSFERFICYPRILANTKG